MYVCMYVFERAAETRIRMHVHVREYFLGEHGADSTPVSWTANLWCFADGFGLSLRGRGCLLRFECIPRCSACDVGLVALTLQQTHTHNARQFITVFASLCTEDLRSLLKRQGWEIKLCGAFSSCLWACAQD
jgi:hypothetical protein